LYITIEGSFQTTARFRLKRNPVLAPGMSVSVTIGFKPSSEAMSIVPVSALFMKDKKINQRLIF